MPVIFTKPSAGGGGVFDHGALTGLLVDDHRQYILVDGSRGFTSTVSGVMPTQSYHLVTRGYADTLSGTGQTNTASNLGSGEGIFFQKVGADLQFKSLIGSGNITLSADNDTITISGESGGTSDHSLLSNLDYASSGHTGFAPASHTHDDRYYTESEITTISGDIVAQIPTEFDDRYYTETELDNGQLDNRYYTETEIDNFDYITNTQLTTTSGDIVSQIPTDYISDAEMTTISGDIVAQIPTDFYTQAEIATISGDLSAEIDSDISTHSTSGDHDGRYYTETEIDNFDFLLTSEMTTISGDIVSQIPTDYYTTGEVDTISGVLQTNIDGKSDIGHTHTESDITDLGDYATVTELTTTSGDIVSQIPTDFYSISEVDTISGALQTQIDGKADTSHTHDDRYFTESEITTISGDIVAQIPTDFYSQAEITTISGDIVSQIPTDYYTQSEVDTISGVLDAAKSDIDHIHDDRYYTESEIDALWVTWSGAIDHNTIQNTHNLTTDIDHNQLTNYVIGQHRTINDGGSGVTDLWSADKISSEIASASGTTNHSELNQLDYASSGHTGFQPAGDYATNSQLTTTSGDIVDQIPTDYISDAEMTTISGDLQTNIDAKDNYTSWSFAVDGVTKDAITSGDVLDFVGGDNITITRSADDKITISGGAGGGVSDHGELDGLTGDDHEQYLLADGTRQLTADWNIGDYMMGINTVPSYPLHLEHAPGEGNFYQVYAHMSPSGTLGTWSGYYGLFVDIDSDADEDGYTSAIHGAHIDVMSTGDISALAGVYNVVNHNSAASIDSIHGIYSRGALLDGHVTDLYGGETRAYIFLTGAADTAYGYHSGVEMGASGETLGTAYGYSTYVTRSNGTITTGYLFHGIYSGTVGTKWGIYLDGETKSYFSGQVGIKEAAPAADLDINGTLMLLNGTSVNEFSTDGTLAGDSDDAVPTEKAVKAYVDTISGGGVSDHGELDGLADDDHEQYVLVDGSRDVTGSLTIASGVNINSGEEYQINSTRALKIVGTHNILLGDNAGDNISAGQDNICIGRDSNDANNGHQNICIGAFSMTTATNDSYNIAIGPYSLQNSNGGTYNIGIGHSVLSNITSGDYNIAIGSQAGRYNKTGADNVVIGYQAGRGALNNSYSDSTIIGYQAGFELETGGNNVIMGHQASYNITSGVGNVIIGQYALRYNEEGDNNVVVGYQAGHGVSNVDCNNNTLLGYQAGYTVSGTGNIFIGYKAGYNEIGSNKLYIENSDSSTPLIYGEFDNDLVKINGDLDVTGDIYTSGKIGIENVPGDVDYDVVFVDVNASGTLTTNREQNGMFIDIDSSIDRNGNIFLLKGFRTVVTDTGDASTVYGVQTLVEHSNANAGDVSASLWGNLKIGLGSVDLAYGSRNRIRVFDTGNVGTAYSMLGQIQMLAENQTLGTAYGSKQSIEQTAGTITTGYLFHGSYIGTIGTKWGIYLDGETTNYFSGDVGIGTTTPSGKLHVAGSHIFADMGYGYMSRDTNSNLAGMYVNTDNTVRLVTSNTPRLIVSEAGGVTLENGTNINEFSTDDTLAGNSDDAVPTEKAVKAYVDAALLGGEGEVGVVETGSYVGDGNLSQTINLTDSSITIKAIWITRNNDDAVDGSNATVYYCQAEMAANRSIIHIAGGGHQVRRNEIIDIDTGWFKVDDDGADAHPNTDGHDYDYVVVGTKTVQTYAALNTSSYVKVTHTESAGTAGGTFSEGDWRTRPLNTEDNDPDGVCTLSSNQITLAAGTYECRIAATAFFVDRNVARLRNVTGGTTVLAGVPAIAGVTGVDQSQAFIMGRFTITASQALEVQHRCYTTNEDDGFGYAGNYGENEVYTVAEFWKIHEGGAQEGVGFNSRAHAYRTGTQSIPNAESTKIELNTENYDGLGEFDSDTNYRFTASSAGYYSIVSQFTSTSSIADGKLFILRLKLNDTSYIGTTRYMTAGAANAGFQVSALLHLDAADYVELFLYHNVGGATNIVFSAEDTFMSVHRLS